MTERNNGSRARPGSSGSSGGGDTLTPSTGGGGGRPSGASRDQTWRLPPPPKANKVERQDVALRGDATDAFAAFPPRKVQANVGLYRAILEDALSVAHGGPGGSVVSRRLFRDTLRWFQGRLRSAPGCSFAEVLAALDVAADAGPLGDYIVDVALSRTAPASWRKTHAVRGGPNWRQHGNIRSKIGNKALSPCSGGRKRSAAPGAAIPPTGGVESDSGSGARPARRRAPKTATGRKRRRS